MMVLDRSSTIAKPISFGNMSKSCCRKKWTKMKLTFDIEFPSVEVVEQVVVDQVDGAWSSCEVGILQKSIFHGERKGSTCSFRTRPWDKNMSATMEGIKTYRLCDFSILTWCLGIYLSWSGGPNLTLVAVLTLSILLICHGNEAQWKQKRWMRGELAI